MTSLLALDLATRLGWACGPVDGEPVSGWFKLPSTGDDVGAFLKSYDQWLRPVISERKPDRIVVESPMPTQSGRTTQVTIRKLYGLISHTELICAYLGIPIAEVDAVKWKVSFCGTGRVSKKMKPYPPVVKCRELGWSVKDDNEADALGLFVHAARLISPSTASRFDPLFRSAS